MDERYLRFPRWLEASGLAARVHAEIGPSGWLVFRRLIEEDLSQNLFPDWVDAGSIDWPTATGLPAGEGRRLLLKLAEAGLFETRDLGGGSGDFLQYRAARPLPVPRSVEEIGETLRKWGLPTRPELWRYWEETAGETKYDRVLRLYEKTCGLKISSRIVEDLVELAEEYPHHQIEKGFAAAREEGVSALAWVRKYLKRARKDDRVQKDWGRPEGFELPQGYSIPGGEGDDGAGG